jgi:hypothetical protein
MLPAGVAHFPAAGELVHRVPSPCFRILIADAFFFVTGFKVRRLPLMPVGVAGFAALGSRV